MTSKSPFAGIDPYLNSYVQAGHWKNFHSVHITHLYERLDSQLPQGYSCASEDALQVRRTLIPEMFDLPPVILEPDVAVYRKSSESVGTSSSNPIMTIPLLELQEDIEPLSGVVIYKITGAGHADKPVTRIELLSPANKIGGSYHKTYLDKRLESLRAGLNLVEIDYLHETPPVLAGLTSYPTRDKDAYPYRVIVSNPHPSYAQGFATIYGFGVDEPLPVISVPLDKDDKVLFELGIPYKDTAYSGRRFRDAMDYSQLPLNFERYSPEDQTRIRNLVDQKQD